MTRRRNMNRSMVDWSNPAEVAEYRVDSRVRLQTDVLRSRLDDFYDVLVPVREGALGAALSDEEFDAIWAENDPGFEAPYEIRTLYMWHNGTFGGTPWVLNDLWTTLTFRQRWARHMLDPASREEMRPISPEHTSFLPIFGENAGSLIADCSGGPDVPCPLYRMGNQEGFVPVPTFPSILSLVDAFHFGLRQGWWVWNTSPEEYVEGVAPDYVGTGECNVPGIAV